MSSDYNEQKQRLHRKLDLLLRTGIILFESAADTNRIVRNMKRVAAFLGLEERYLHIEVLYGSLKVNYSDETHSFGKSAYTDRYAINMKAISSISQLSWRALQEDYTMSRFEAELQRIGKMKPEYPLWLATLCTALACGGFCVLFGGDWPSFLPAAFAGFVGYAFRSLLLKEKYNGYMVTALTSFVATLAAWLTTFVSPAFTDTPYHPFLSCALFLVPGVALINFLDDMLDNYLLVGLARLANSIVQVAAMTFGIVLAVQVCGVTNFLTDLDMRPDHSYWQYAIATGIASIGFAMNFNVPRRTLPVVALLGIIAFCLRCFLGFDLGWGLIIGSLAGSVLVSLLAVRIVHHAKTPNHVLSIPSVIPMVPGILMYRGIFGLVQTSNDVGILTGSINNLMNAGLIVLCISLGVAIPNIFARRWIAKSRKIQVKRLINDRRKRGKFVNLSDFD